MPENAVARLDAVNGKMQRRRQRLEQVELRRKELRAEAAGLEVHESLARLAPRIEAMQEQGPWINSLQAQVASLEKEAADSAAAIAAEQKQLGLDGDAAALPAIPPRTLSTLQSAGRGLRRARKRRARLQQAAEAAEDAVRSLASQIDAAISGRQDRELSAAIDRAGNLVAQFRRRIQIDERLEQMAGCQRDLEAQTRRLLGRQLLPGWAIVGLGAVFVLGVVLFLTGLFLPASLVGPVGGAMAVLGLAGCGAAGLGKVLLERSNARQLEACQNQLNLLQLQVKQMGEDRDAMDGQLPRGGPIAGRLAAAEKDLAALEELMPVDARLTAAKQEAAAARERLVREEQEHRRRAAPLAFGPGRRRPAATACPRAAQASVAEARADCAAPAATRPAPGGTRPSPPRTGFPLGANHATDRRGRDRPGRRPSHRAAPPACRRPDAAGGSANPTTRGQPGASPQPPRSGEAGGGDRPAEGFAADSCSARRARGTRRSFAAGRSRPLAPRRSQHDRDVFDQEIAAAVAGHCTQETIRQFIEGSPAQELEPRRDDFLQRWAAAEEQLQQRFEKRGQLAEQLKSLAEDRQLAQKQLDLALVEKRLEDALRRWQTLAVAARVLDAICSTYERERQPETLQEASGYLERLTEGHYLRVWTPLGQNVLRVDDAEGRWLPVEALSRGTREQLFLSLRLALVAGYARCGAPLPLVLDDVLVNFDIARARAAVAVLRDFAAAGHQVLIFTCHEHMLRLFKSLHTPVGRLPDSRDLAPAAIVFDEPGSEKSARSRRSPAGPRRAAARLAPAGAGGRRRLGRGRAVRRVRGQRRRAVRRRRQRRSGVGGARVATCRSSALRRKSSSPPILPPNGTTTASPSRRLFHQRPPAATNIDGDPAEIDVRAQRGEQGDRRQP